MTFGVSKLLLGNPPHTEANSFTSCKAENANSQCNRIAHARHTKDVSKLLCSAHTGGIFHSWPKDVSKLLCSAHTVRNISLVAKIIKHDRYLELRLEWTKSYRNCAHTGAMCWVKWHEWHLAKQIALVCTGFKTISFADGHHWKLRRQVLQKSSW